MRTLFSSESVTEGHPDKVCDKISDAVLDAHLQLDPESRVACETMVKTGGVILAGEITSKGTVDYQQLVRDTLREIGYDSRTGFNYEDVAVFNWLSKQSPDISQGVTEGEGDFKEQGAGDQGLMFGYAVNEAPEFMPLPIYLAHRLTEELADFRKTGQSWLFPDGKSQVAVAYEDGKPVGLENIILAAHHASYIRQEEVREYLLQYVVKPALKDLYKVVKPACKDLLTKDTKVFINATGRFVEGGPKADAGLTGRKIIVDTYGGKGRHGGGAFSGKDPSKVDRSGAYAARYIAKNIVAAELADECEVQLAYCIGVAMPTSIRCDLNFPQTGEFHEKLSKVVYELFPVKPADIIRHFGLKNPQGWCYKETAAYGHFGRSQFPWERTDKAEELKSYFK